MGYGVVYQYQFVPLDRVEERLPRRSISGERPYTSVSKLSWMNLGRPRKTLGENAMTFPFDLPQDD